MLDLSVDEALKRYERVEHLMHETLISLLTAFDDRERSFYTSLHEKRPSKPSFRDSAAVLTAIESAAKPIMDTRVSVGPPPPREKYLADALKHVRNGIPEPLSYHAYQRLFFDPCVDQISNGEPSEILGKSVPPEDRKPWEYRDAFTCSRIVMLLHLFNDKTTHKRVYVEALSEVAQALARSSSPHYVFGGASIAGDPHSFVSHYALRAIGGLVEILNQRAEQHERFSSLLQKIVEWQDDTSSVRLESEKQADFNESLRSPLQSFKASVGLEDMAQETLVHLGLQPHELAKHVLGGITTDVLPWVSGFLELVQLERGKLEETLKAEHNAIAKKWQEDSKEGSKPGEALTHSVQDYHRCAGLAWVVALFEGMRHVLSGIQAEYKRLDETTDLAAIAGCVKKVAGHWRESGSITEFYVTAFAKWATAEVRKQLSAWDLTSRRGFDAGQLAFGIRILHDLTPREHSEMVERGLAVLAEDQAPDGTWRAGAPVAFISEPLAAIYAATMEIANALVQVVKQRGELKKYGRLLERVYDWLEASRQSVWLMGTHDKISGWTTDRIKEHNRVDVWMGAIALEFLAAYRGLLEDHAKATLLDGQYNRQGPARLTKWSDLVDSDLEKRLSERTTKKIFDDFIRPFKERGDHHKTGLILYGPPGTAKTTVTAAMASELDWDLVTITPSDFVKEGIERSEDSARRIFADLLRLRHVVVLFDEIDEMLRSRNEPEENPTGVAMLRFLVPGMLPKLQQLKQHGERAGVIFVIATNFRERLDPAIVRPGRIDGTYLIPPPDRKARELLLRRMLVKKRVNVSIEPQQFRALCHWLADRTGGWVYKELESLAEVILRTGLGSNPGKFYEEHGSALSKGGNCLDLKVVGTEPWEGWSIAGLQRALKLEEQYQSRKKAREELGAVLSVCWPDSTKDEATEAIEKILASKTPEGPPVRA
jgi:hypothetical protein